MSWKQTAVVAGLAIALVCVSGCRQAKEAKLAGPPGPGQHHGLEDGRVFRVYIYADPDNPGKCLADWPVGTLWRNKHQTVLWISDDGGQYTVDFTQGHHPAPSTPFQDATFDVESNGVTPSKSLQPGASGYYDFAIRSGGGNGSICKDTSDPGYYVK
jgi:hypothetical protein